VNVESLSRLKIESRTMDLDVKESHNYKVYVFIKKLNTEEKRKFNLDINEPKIKLTEKKDVKGKLKPKESAKNTLPGKNKEKTTLKSISKPKTKLKVTENLKLKEPKLIEKQGGKVKCPQCGKKYADSMALEYHKITFHVEEEETKLFSESIYHEQMSFDKNVLRLNESDVGQSRRTSITSEQNNKEKDISNEKRKRSKEKTETNKTKKTHEVKKDKKDKNEILEHQKPIVENTKTSSIYCICDKPERDDMIGCDFCEAWYHPECIGLDEKQAIEVTKSPSWKCPKCIEEEIYAKKEKLNAKTMQMKKLSIAKPQNAIRKSVKPKPSKKKIINILEASDSSSDSLSNDEAKEKLQKATKKFVKPQALKKKSINIIQDSDSSSNSLSIDESKENPHKGIKKLVKPKPSKTKSMKLFKTVILHLILQAMMKPER